MDAAADESRTGGERQTVRLALCGLSDMVSDIVCVLLQQVADIEVVLHLDDSGDLRADFERSGADLLICSLPQRDMEERWRRTLDQPVLAVLNLREDHKAAHFYRLHPDEQTIDPIAADSLVAALRQHVSALRGGAVRAQHP
jgi:DNA-binding transcriptional LysR family regulator